MHRNPTTALTLLALFASALAACSSSPSNPVNQTPPIQTMDNFFRSLNGQPTSPPATIPYYAREPGYAPAYPPYSP